MFRHLCTRSKPCIQSARRSIFGLPTPWRADLHRKFDLMEREFDRAFRYPFWSQYEFRPIRMENVADMENYRLQNPIVEEDGVKKFKLEFDVNRFKPEEVNVKTNAKDNTITIEAKHEDETSKFELNRTLTAPSGVTLSELKCKLTSNGSLQLEAPYNPPPEKAPLPDTDIPIKHE